jgi:hypothetical protein
MGFINNANQIIGANMRYLQQFQAGQQQTSASGSQGASGTDAAAMQAMMPMLLMMLMLKLMGQDSGQPGMPQTYPPRQGFPGGSFYPPHSPSPSGPPQNAEQWIRQNPAYQFLSTLLPGLDTPVSANAASSASSASAQVAQVASTAKPDFFVNDSLASAMNALLASSQNVSRHSLGTQLISGATNGVDLDDLKAQVQDEMSEEGRSPKDIQAFGLLFDAMRNNTALGVSRLLTDDDSKAQTAQLNQAQQDLSRQWDDLASAASADDTAIQTATATSATTTSTPSIPTLVQNVRSALADGRFTRQQLGQTLKYLLDKGPAEALPQLGGLIGGLMDSGDLNISAFLNAKYLDKLSPAAKNTLLDAVKSAGLTTSDGKPNSRFAVFLMENVLRSEVSSTGTFLRQFLQYEWQQNGADTTSAEGKALHSLLTLAGIDGTVGQPLVFPT